MNFLSLAQTRYSTRAYLPKPVEPEKLAQILEAGRVAPTAANQQPNHFLVLTEAADFQKLHKGANPHGAPLVIIICSDRTIALVRPFDQASMVDIDATIATDHMMMCATDLGLGSCWITYFDPAVIRQEFHLPDHITPVNILAVGYAATAPASPSRHEKTRKSLAEMTHYHSF